MNPVVLLKNPVVLVAIIALALIYFSGNSVILQPGTMLAGNINEITWTNHRIHLSGVSSLISEGTHVSDDRFCINPRVGRRFAGMSKNECSAVGGTWVAAYQQCGMTTQMLLNADTIRDSFGRNMEIVNGNLCWNQFIDTWSNSKLPTGITLDYSSSFDIYPVSYCGNGIIESGEACDDGNVNSGDGCSYNCMIETQQQMPKGFLEILMDGFSSIINFIRSLFNIGR